MVGDPQKKLQSIYDEARDLGHPVLVFFDECDGLFRNDAGGNEGVTLSLVTTLKRILGNPADYPNVLSTFATNSIKGFDEALLRAGRFNTILAIDKPTDSVRVNVFIDKLARDGHHFVAELFFPLTADAYDDGTEFSGRTNAFESAIAESEGFTPADYEAVLAKLRATRMKHELQTGEEAPLLDAQQLVAAILAHRKSRPN